MYKKVIVQDTATGKKLVGILMADYWQYDSVSANHQLFVEGRAVNPREFRIVEEEPVEDAQYGRTNVYY